MAGGGRGELGIAGQLADFEHLRGAECGQLEEAPERDEIADAAQVADIPLQIGLLLAPPVNVASEKSAASENVASANSAKRGNTTARKVWLFSRWASSAAAKASGALSGFRECGCSGESVGPRHP